MTREQEQQEEVPIYAQSKTEMAERAGVCLGEDMPLSPPLFPKDIIGKVPDLKTHP